MICVNAPTKEDLPQRIADVPEWGHRPRVPDSMFFVRWQKYNGAILPIFEIRHPSLRRGSVAQMGCIPPTKSPMGRNV